MGKKRRTFLLRSELRELKTLSVDRLTEDEGFRELEDDELDLRVELLDRLDVSERDELFGGRISRLFDLIVFERDVETVLRDCNFGRSREVDNDRLAGDDVSRRIVAVLPCEAGVGELRLWACEDEF